MQQQQQQQQQASTLRPDCCVQPRCQAVERQAAIKQARVRMSASWVCLASCPSVWSACIQLTLLVPASLASLLVCLLWPLPSQERVHQRWNSGSPQHARSYSTVFIHTHTHIHKDTDRRMVVDRTPNHQLTPSALPAHISPRDPAGLAFRLACLPSSPAHPLSPIALASPPTLTSLIPRPFPPSPSTNLFRSLFIATLQQSAWPPPFFRISIRVLSRPASSRRRHH